jgi:thiamine transport system permease protein
VLRFPPLLGWISVLWSASFWVGLVLVPVLALLAESGGGEVPLLDPVILAIAGMTFVQALMSSVLASGIGLVLGLWAGDIFSRSSARFLRFLLLLPYGVPTVVAGLAWIGWLGQSGLGWAYSLKAVVVAHVFFNVPYVALLVAEARAVVPRSQLEASRLLGAGWPAEFRFVAWPLIWRSYLSASAQVLSLCAMSFGLVMVLGGGPPVETLETALYARIRFGELDVPGAVACAIWQLAIVMFPWALVLWLGNAPTLRKGGRREFAEVGARVRREWLCSSMAFLFFLPYLPAIRALPRALDSPELASPILVSLTIAVLSGLAAVVTALFAVGATAFTGAGRVLPLLFAIPSGISVLVLGLGAWIAYGGWIDPFEGSLAAIIGLQTAVFFPVAFRMLWPQVGLLRVDLLESASTLGASPVRAFLWVEWPRWKKLVFGTWAIGAAAALGEIAVVSFFYSENLVTLPLMISRWMARYRFDDAEAAAAVLLTISCALIALISWMEIPDANTRANR